MFKKTKNYLDRSFPLLLSHKKGWGCLAVVILLIALMMNVLQPFGISTWHHSYKCFILCAYSINYALAYVCIYLLLSRFFHESYRPETWTVGKEVCILVLFFPLSGVLNWIFSLVLVTGFTASLFSFFQIQLYSLIVGTIPVIMLGFYIDNRFKTPRQIGAPQVPAITPTQELPTVLPPSITINGTNLLLAEIFFVEVKGNNLIIRLHRDTKITERIVRFTLKDFMLLVKSQDPFHYCSQSFVVNMDWVLSASGNLSNIYLKLPNYAATITVSRSFTHSIKQVLTDRQIYL